MNETEQIIYDWLRKTWCNDLSRDHCYACARQAKELDGLVRASVPVQEESER